MMHAPVRHSLTSNGGCTLQKFSKSSRERSVVLRQVEELAQCILSLLQFAQQARVVYVVSRGM